MAARKKKAKSVRPRFTNSREFEALSDEEKDRIVSSYDRKVPLSETRPLTASERAEFEQFRRKAGRPRIGQGAKVVAVTLEKGFLERVDAYARKHEMKRAELITKGLRIVMGENRPA